MERGMEIELWSGCEDALETGQKVRSVYNRSNAIANIGAYIAVVTGVAI